MLDIGIFQFFIMIDQVYENLKELAPPQQDKPISLKLLEASKSSNLTIEKEPKKLIDFREGTKDMDKKPKRPCNHILVSQICKINKLQVNA